MQVLREHGASVASGNRELRVESRLPHFMRLSGDEDSAGITIYTFKVSRTHPSRSVPCRRCREAPTRGLGMCAGRDNSPWQRGWCGERCAAARHCAQRGWHGARACHCRVQRGAGQRGWRALGGHYPPPDCRALLCQWGAAGGFLPPPSRRYRSAWGDQLFLLQSPCGSRHHEEEEEKGRRIQDRVCHGQGTARCKWRLLSCPPPAVAHTPQPPGGTLQMFAARSRQDVRATNEQVLGAGGDPWVYMG